MTTVVHSYLFPGVEVKSDIDHQVAELSVLEVESITVGKEDGYWQDDNTMGRIREIIIQTKTAGLVILYCATNTGEKGRKVKAVTIPVTLDVETDAEDLAATAKCAPLPTIDEVAKRIADAVKEGEVDSDGFLQLDKDNPIS